VIRLSAGADTLSALGYASQYLRGITNRGSTNGKSSKATVLLAEACFYFKTGIDYIINAPGMVLLLSELVTFRASAEITYHFFSR
jgi:hypothetical protein